MLLCMHRVVLGIVCSYCYERQQTVFNRHREDFDNNKYQVKLMHLLEIGEGE